MQKRADRVPNERSTHHECAHDEHGSSNGYRQDIEHVLDARKNRDKPEQN